MAPHPAQRFAVTSSMGLRRMLHGAPLSLGAKAFVLRKKSRLCGNSRFGWSGYSVASTAI